MLLILLIDLVYLFVDRLVAVPASYFVEKPLLLLQLVSVLQELSQLTQAFSIELFFLTLGCWEIEIK